MNERVRIRVGTGFDVHKLVPGRKLILCGEEIPYELGLEAHSDGDVAVHALMDALLGAAGLGDIGRHFPDTDEEYAGADSMELLEKVMDMLKEKGYTPGNCDITLICQAPKLAPFAQAMRSNVARTMGISEDEVNIKASTTEHLGFTGRGEGIAAQAVCTIYQE